MADHPQRFRVFGRVNIERHAPGYQTWWGLDLMQEGLDWFRLSNLPPELRPEGFDISNVASVTLRHIPPGSGWLYHVIGEGLDYLGCPTCRPDQPVVDNRRAPAE